MACQRYLLLIEEITQHWFIKATAILQQCGLSPTPNNPHPFCGKLDGEHELYIGFFLMTLSTSAQITRRENHLKKIGISHTGR